MKCLEGRNYVKDRSRGEKAGSLFSGFKWADVIVPATVLNGVKASCLTRAGVAYASCSHIKPITEGSQGGYDLPFRSGHSPQACPHICTFSELGLYLGAVFNWLAGRIATATPQFGKLDLIQ